MTERQRQRWAHLRQLGRGRFVLLYGVLVFGGIFGILLPFLFGLILIVLGEHSLSVWQWVTLIWFLPVGLSAGLLFGLVIWSDNERQFSREPLPKDVGWADPIRQIVWPGTVLSVLVYGLCALTDVALPFRWIAVLLAGLLGAVGGHLLGKVQEGKKKITFLAIVGFWGTSAFWLLFTMPTNKSHFNRIHEGMSLDEVVKMLGPPDTDSQPRFDLGIIWTEKQLKEGRFAACNLYALTRNPAPNLPPDIRRWTSGRCVIAVNLDNQDRVLDKEFVEAYRSRNREMPWEKVLRFFTNPVPVWPRLFWTF